MKTIAYKIVQRRDDKLFSCFISGEAEVEYAIGKTTLPKVKGSKLFAFESLTAAQRWVCDLTDIYECEVENTKSLTTLPLFSQRPTYNVILHAWEKGYKSWGGRAPQGTIVCSSIKLTKVARKGHQKT